MKKLDKQGNVMKPFTENIHKTQTLLSCKKRKDNNSGITLIALIITIIVLLILAGITINLTIGENGIITKAKEAGKTYQNAAENEQTLLGEFLNETEDIINGLSGTTTEAPNYKTLASVAKPGDYVEYDGGNGYTGLWQVLYNDDTYGLQIISANTTEQIQLFQEETEEAAILAWNTAVDTLNEYSRKYINTLYAISGRSVGSDPLNPDDRTTETIIWAYNNTDTGLKIIDENYLKDKEAMDAATSQNTEGIRCIEDEPYWVASRNKEGNNTSQLSVAMGCAYYESYHDYPGDGNLMHPAYNILLDSSRGLVMGKNTFGLRPVITLKSDVHTNGGNGTSDLPWKLTN